VQATLHLEYDTFTCDTGVRSTPHSTVLILHFLLLPGYDSTPFYRSTWICCLRSCLPQFCGYLPPAVLGSTCTRAVTTAIPDALITCRWTYQSLPLPGYTTLRDTPAARSFWIPPACSYHHYRLPVLGSAWRCLVLPAHGGTTAYLAARFTFTRTTRSGSVGFQFYLLNFDLFTWLPRFVLPTYHCGSRHRLRSATGYGWVRCGFSPR